MKKQKKQLNKSEKMNTIKVTVAANITYSGLTYNTKLLIEYKHTGKLFYTKKRGANHETETSHQEIAQEWENKGLKVRQTNGYYFIDRLAIPTTNANGKIDIWYINNPGDSYIVNRVSKFAKKLHEKLSTETPVI